MFIPLKSILSHRVGQLSSAPALKSKEMDTVYSRVVEEILNKKAAQNSRVLFFRNRILTIGVPSSVWACQLRFAQESILDKINSLFGKKIVERIVFRVR